MAEIEELAVTVEKNSSSLLKQRRAYLLSNYSANQGNHTSFKIITNRIFHRSSSRSFCMKGVYFNKL